MAGTDIKLTPEVLLAQSMELSSLQTEFESLFSEVSNTLNGMNDSWSAVLAGNFAGKITAAQKSFSSVANMLANGSSAAKLSANTFASPGAVLSMLCKGENSAFSKVSDLSSWLAGYLDKYGSFPNGMGEMIDTLADMAGIDTDTMKSVLEKISDGDYEGALRAAGEKGIDTVAGWMSGDISSDSWVGQLQELTGGKLGLSGLEKSYFKNLFGDTFGTAGNIVKDMYSDNPDYGYELNQLGQFAWNIGPGAAIKTTGDAAYNVIKNIPGVGDFYAERGATDGESMISAAIGELTYMVTGDREAAAADADYYRAHGGFAQGVVDGVADISSFVGERIGTTWHSVFGK